MSSTLAVAASAFGCYIRYKFETVLKEEEMIPWIDQWPLENFSVNMYEIFDNFRGPSLKIIWKLLPLQENGTQRNG